MAVIGATWAGSGLTARGDGSEFTGRDIGDATPPGSFRVVAGGVDVAGGGSDIGGNADRFHFCYRTQTGDFDWAVQVQALDGSDVWAKAGLMARVNLDPESPFSSAFATPILSGCFFQSRTSDAGKSVLAGSFPVNYPFSFLRLKRAGDVFSGFASIDGQHWFLLGTNSMSVTNTVFFGLAVTSHNTNQLASAQFRNLAVATDGGSAGWPEDFEPLGPSSRRSGLVISEIMYRPAPRPDQRDLEFIELFNANPFFEDISGYALTGDADFTFPPGTILPGGGFAVVARSPEDLRNVSGLAKVFGPYPESLPSSGTMRLRDKAGAILFEVSYSNRPPWPVAAHGTGHSLVLSRPSYGESDPRAWAPSGLKGGSPGRIDGVRQGPWRKVRINEWLANATDPATHFLELYNHSNETVDLSGCILTDDPTVRKFTIPSGTTVRAGGFVSFTQQQLGFTLEPTGLSVFLTSPDQLQVLDAVRIDGHGKGVSTGRKPDGAAEFFPMTSSTPGAANAAIWVEDIVINEIMYHPISEAGDEEYVELHNRGNQSVNLGGWKFLDGIEYTFAPGQTIPPGGFLVVARNAARLLASSPNLSAANTVGNFSGNLSGRGERIALARPEVIAIRSSNQAPATNATMDVIVDEVTYGTGGRWGNWADGGGSSLELVDARAPHRWASNWADSEETAKSVWTTLESTGALDHGAGSIDSLHVFLLGEGECLLDDVQVYAVGNSTNLIANSTFESGLAGWAPLGNYVRTSLETTEGYNSRQSLHIRGSDRGDTGANRIRVPLIAGNILRSGGTATIRAKVRWLRGFPEIVLRLKGNYLEATGRMTLPQSPGTPGARNSRALANAGPSLSEVAHHPPLPAAGEPVVVTVKAEDPDGISKLVLKYRIDPSTNVVTVAMNDQGINGDAVTGDGVWSAQIPGQPGGSLAAFHLEASDNAASPLSTLVPSAAPARECLVRFGEPSAPSSFGTYRLWFTANTLTAWRQRAVLSNEDLDGTFVYGHQRVIYNIGARYSGSPWHQSSYASPTSGLCTYALTLPKDDMLLGTASFNKLHAPGNTPGDDGTIQSEQTAYWMVRQLGLPWNYQRYVNVYLNGTRRGSLMEDTQVPGSEVIREHFPNDAEGDLYKLNGWYEFDNATSGAMPFGLQSWCTLNNYVTTNGDKKLARYRYNWSPRATRGTANNYTNLFALVDAANTPPTGSYAANMEALADTTQWLRTFAIEHAVGNWDSFGNRNAQNMYAYKPANDRWKLLIWDFNIVLGNSGSDGPSGDNLFQFYGPDRGIARIYNHPGFLRTYLQTLQEIAGGPMLNANADPILDAKYAAIRANGLTVSAPNSIKSWINSRRRYLSNFLTNFVAPFAISNNEGSDFSTNRNWFALTGVAPIDVKTVTLNGEAYSIVWDNVFQWRLEVPLHNRTNRLTVQGLDSQGQIVSNATATVTVTFTGEIESPQQHLVINEIMSHPPREGAEFVEIFNTSTRSAFDLSHCRLRGVDFDFNLGTILEPGGYLVVAKNRTTFAAAYGSSIPLAGEFAGRLDRFGETLQLVRLGASPAQEVLLDEVNYAANPSWPAGASGSGASLQLIDPKLDNSLGQNWTTVRADLATRPDWKFVSVTATAGRSRLLIYHSPLQTPPDPKDLSGLWEGSILPPVDYQMSVEFARSGTNRWTGTFFGQDYTGPLASISYVNTNINLTLAAEVGAPRLQGSLSPQGDIISGSFIQSTPTGMQSFPFSLRRYVDPKAVWGGDVYLDDLKLVAGNVPEAGRNLIRDGEFEASLAANWNVSSNHAGSALSTVVKRSGQSSLHLIASLGGEDAGSAVWQDTDPLVAGGTYTLSYWYLPSTNGVDLTVRLLESELAGVRSLQPDKPATPGARNSGSDAEPGDPLIIPNDPPPQIFINEWMAANSRTLPDPADSQFDDWFELYNPGTNTVDLSGYFLTDTAADKTKWRIPAGTTISPKGFLLVWADEDTGQNQAHAALHVNFKLSQNGEELGLVAPDGTIVDWITFGQQTADVSQGRSTDGGGGPFQFLGAATPNAANSTGNGQANELRIVRLEESRSGVISFSWTAQPGRSYQVQVQSSLSAPDWANLGSPVKANGDSVDFREEIAPFGPQRFYRVMLVE